MGLTKETIIAIILGAFGTFLAAWVFYTVNSFDDKLESLRTEISNSQPEELASKFAVLEAKVDSLANGVVKTEQKVAVLEDHKQTFSTKQQLLEKQVDDLRPLVRQIDQNQVDSKIAFDKLKDVKDRVDGIQDSLQPQLESGIQGARHQNGRLAARLDTLEQVRLSLLEDDVGACNRSTSRLTKVIEGLEGKLEAKNTEIASLESKIKGLESLGGRVGEISDQIGEYDKRLERINERLSERPVESADSQATVSQVTNSLSRDYCGEGPIGEAREGRLEAPFPLPSDIKIYRPKSLRHIRIDAVEMCIDIDEEGRVTFVDDGSPANERVPQLFLQGAEEALYKRRYRPGRKNGNEVKWRLQVDIPFD